MKAIIIQTAKKNNPLVWQEVPAPTYSDDEVLVNIHATALNRAAYKAIIATSTN